MKELAKKQRLRKILYSVPILLVLIVPTFFLAKGALGILTKERENSRKVEELKLLTGELNERQNSLRNSITGLQTEEGIESEIRSRFNVAKSGELVAIIIENELPATSTEPTGFERLRKSLEFIKNLWW